MKEAERVGGSANLRLRDFTYSKVLAECDHLTYGKPQPRVPWHLLSNKTEEILPYLPQTHPHGFGVIGISSPHVPCIPGYPGQWIAATSDDFIPANPLSHEDADIISVFYLGLTTTQRCGTVPAAVYMNHLLMTKGSNWHSP